MEKKYDFEKTAVRVSIVSITGNILLTIFKLVAGIVAHSSAMISDGIHSASDVLSSGVVIAGVKISSKEEDKEHPYGHERIESVAALVLVIILVVTGIFIGHTAIERLKAGDSAIAMPGMLALIAAGVSILVKEAMYRYTKHYAKKIDSSALLADAWHHRSDALSSIGALIGIGGARLGFLWLDPVASIVICLFIMKASYDIFMEATEKLVDHAIDDGMIEEMRKCAMEQPGVIEVGRLQSRQSGKIIYVDIEVFADGELSLRESNEIAERVHRTIEDRFEKVKHISVVVKPYQK